MLPLHVCLVLLYSLRLANAGLAEGCHAPRMVDDILVADCVDPDTGEKFMYVDVDGTVWASYYAADDNADAGSMIYAKWENSTDIDDKGLLQRRRDPPSPDAISLQSLGQDDQDIDLSLQDPRAGPFGPDVELGLGRSAVQTVDGDTASGDRPSTFINKWGKALKPYHFVLGCLSGCALFSISSVSFHDTPHPVGTRMLQCSAVEGVRVCASIEANNPDFSNGRWLKKIERECFNHCRLQGDPCEYALVKKPLFGSSTVEYHCGLPAKGETEVVDLPYLHDPKYITISDPSDDPSDDPINDASDDPINDPINDPSKDPTHDSTNDHTSDK